MGEWNKSESFSLDADARATLAWLRERFSPMFDMDRWKSPLVRFALKQYAVQLRVLLAMPDIMQAFVRAQQSLNLPKVAQTVIEFPVAAPIAGEGPESSRRNTGLIKFSRLRAAVGVAVAASGLLSRERTHVERRLAAF